MMNVHQAAIKWECSRTSVLKACKAGNVQGAHKEKNSACRNWAYMIPKDVPRPECIKPRPRPYQKHEKAVSLPIPCLSARNVDPDVMNAASYIWQNQGKKTISQLAKDLGITCKRVTELFDLSFSLFDRKEACK